MENKHEAGQWPSNQPPSSDLPSLALEEKRKIWQRRFAESDAEAGIETTPDFEPFSQINDMFSRAFWDETVKSPKTQGFFDSHRVNAKARKAEGFRRPDMALRTASWAVSNMIADRRADEGYREGFQALITLGGEVADEPYQPESIEEFTRETKATAKFLGADLVGITERDERWHYSKRSDMRDWSEDEPELPEGLNTVIVMGHEMDHELVKTYPSALASASAGAQYSHEAGITLQLVTWLRNLGYEAYASMNDTALVIPYAVKAGLGEYARNQMVITPEYGPRLRFSKVFTNAPLNFDRPKKSGVHEFCSMCNKCAEACPPKALPFGAPSDEMPNQSAIKGVKKWTADCEKCFGYWAAMSTDCAICMRVCPYNRSNEGIVNRLINKVFFKLAGSRFRALALKLDGLTKRAERLKPLEWWKRQASSG